MSHHDLARDVGRLLRMLREDRGLSQARLAERVGGTQQWLSQVERGLRNTTVRDLERFLGGLGLRLRFEAVRIAAGAPEDPELQLGDSEEERIAGVFGYCKLLERLDDVPLLVGGRLAALAHGLPIRVRRLDLIVASEDRELFGKAMRRFNAVRWSERWQEFCNNAAPERPGPLRWLIGSAWELRAAVAEELPPGVSVRLGDRELRVPPLPWLLSADADIVDLLERLTAAGWRRPVASPGEV